MMHKATEVGRKQGVNRNKNLEGELTVKPLEINAASYKRSIALRASSSSWPLWHTACIITSITITIKAHNINNTEIQQLRTITYMQTFDNWMLRINLKHPPASHELQSRWFTDMLCLHQPERGDINANNIRKEMVIKLNCTARTEMPCRKRTPMIY